jgi:hypothetical protein
MSVDSEHQYTMGGRMEDETPKTAGRRKHDMRVRAMPVPTVADWRDPEATLETLRLWAEGNATDAIDWYLRDKAWKRVASRLLRACAILSAVAGGIAPLVAAASDQSANWGYIMLALAAGCVGFDHFFGLSSGWMRDMTTARAVERRLGAFRFGWASANAERAFGTGAPATPAGLALIQQFTVDVADLIDAETAEWLSEFRANITNFVTQRPPAGSDG